MKITTGKARTDGARNRIRLAGTSIVALTASAALALVLTGTAGKAVAADPRPALQLTAAQVSALEQLNSAQAARLDQALGKALGQFGVRAGVETGSPARSGISLDAKDWSVGHDLTHLWVTASYANLWPYKQAIHKLGDWADDVDSACGALAGYEIAGQAAEDLCDLVAGTIAWLASRVNFPDTGSHGVWATFYWIPWGDSQSGYW
jgi:hypothetical protein